MRVSKTCLFVSFLFVLLVAVSAFLTFFQREVFYSDKVAIVKIEGTIMDAEETVDELREYEKDDSIKAILLRVDSPGGDVVASQELYEEVKRAAALKKVIVSMGSMAASGGYYLSAPASRIVANAGTITGSIGVIMEVPNIKGLMERIGVKSDVIKSGRLKDMASLYRELKPEERRILEGVMADLHGQFIEAVAESRKLPIDKVKELADGRVFSGNQALKLGLVDELGTFRDALEVAAQEAGIKGEPAIVVRKETPPFWEGLSRKLFEGASQLFPRSEMKYLYLP